MSLSFLLVAAALIQRAADGEGVPAPLPHVAPARTVTLGELRVSPSRFLREEVSFVLQFKATLEAFDPFLSRFDPARWLELEGWPDEAFTWDRTVFGAPARRLFVRRGGGFEPLVRRAKPFQRFEVRARVREAFLGEPWLELVELVPLDGEVGEGTILHVTRARELAAQGQHDHALDQYERALSAPLPPHALAALRAERDQVEEARDAARDGS